ncbi:MAG: hypothetical protein ACYDH6_17905 [Acidimicrobiales bacterium]
MTIAKGRPWGRPGPLPADGVVARSDAEARDILETARRAGRPVPVLGLLGGDLCRTLGGRGELSRLRSADAVTFPIDIARVVARGTSHWFVAHLIARNRLWTRARVVMNGAWLGTWNLAPRSHPNDGLLDVIDARLRLADLRPIRARLAHGSHLPHPRLAQSRVAAVDIDPTGLRVWLDGVPLDASGGLRIEVEPDAVHVVV